MFDSQVFGNLFGVLVVFGRELGIQYRNRDAAVSKPFFV